eukprot:Phypoly_transcript_22729.p2 GENE.Phypoly_transcript_22729~~Phypoly_transcript_22729.p2  ORF type:complete len:102 (+),score=24.40 Phypoly_transcript_22729:94-399(+)
MATETTKVVFDIAPWDEETNLDEVEKRVRAIAKPGLVWEQSERQPVVGKIFKLRIGAKVEASVSTEELTETIQGWEALFSPSFTSFFFFLFSFFLVTHLAI